MCVFQYKPNDDIEIGIGECKSEGGIITQNDCENLKRVAQKLTSLAGNTDVYLIFSKTSDAFLTEEIERFKVLSKDTKIILLSNKELEPYHIYWLDGGGIEEDVPEKYPISLSDLAKNSYARYLKT